MDTAKADALHYCSNLTMRMHDPLDLCMAAIERLHEKLDYRRGAVLLTRPSDGRLHVFCHCRGDMGPEEFLREIDRVNRLLDDTDDGITARVLRAASPSIVNDVDACPYYVSAAPEIRAEACFPLIAGGACIGVLNIESARRDAFDADDRTLLSALASQLSLHLDRARLQSFLGLSTF